MSSMRWRRVSAAGISLLMPSASLTEKSDIGQEDIAVLYPRLAALLLHRHTISKSYKLALFQQCSHNRKAAGCDEAFIGKYDFNFPLTNAEFYLSFDAH